ncbi:aldo/keto reductase, partial [Staphylococcus epidermidis]|uniref:aldo/keto reductase n=1 Tax=Staphylococcus epidermidis TaxID=1282 RepID=UPI0037D9A3E4
MTLLHTAYIYPPQPSQQLLPQLVKQYPPHKLQIPTKPSHLIKQNPQLLQNNHPQFLKHQLQNTFQPLQVDYIDFYYI